MKFWLRVHKWSSLVSTLLLLLLCVTGLPLIFTDELSARAPSPSNVGSARQLDAAGPLDSLCAQQRAEPERPFVQFAFWQDGEPDVIGLGVASTADAPLDDVKRVLFDAKTGQTRAEIPPESAILATLLDLHRNLGAGATGDVLLGAMALLFVISSLSGVVLYGPFIHQLDFGAVRTRSPKLKWLDLHNLVGIATVAWALVVGATGLMNTLEARLFGVWQERELPALLAQGAGGAASIARGSLDAAVATARAALPGMQPTSIALAGTRYATPRHHLVWMHGTTKLTRRLFTPVLVDATSGALTMAKPLPWYLRLLELSRPLHFGDYGGLPLKLLWAAFDVLLIFVLGSGVYLWVAKWRPTRAAS